METVLHTVCAVCSQQCIHTDIRRSIIQNITLILNSHSVPTLFNSAPFGAVVPDISTGKIHYPVNAVA